MHGLVKALSPGLSEQFGAYTNWCSAVQDATLVSVDLPVVGGRGGEGT
eukprot:NODE_7827_length_306_cov_5.042802_g7089_i0.p2 GENE.NODE_7827_length_306_cov_5.042802_g7089_i0~~NODE_7827_length_306_cov_5.042802_g7089_i0.p2  ORF type:complete len:55 (+),score=11.38 NODE_7827_length_306_cov_5.042802_g7089_i0:22-165(+)